MVDITPRALENHPGGTASSPGGPNSPGEAHKNGSPATPAADADGQPGKRSGVERAEEIVDHVAARVAALATSAWGKKVLTVAAHAREAVEDFWAEVQNVRHGRKP